MANYKLEFRNIKKSFPGVMALKGVSFGIKQGCVHAIMGENGAGKSTLMKIINGDYGITEGEMLLDNEPVVFKSPDEAKAHNIAMIYQELQYVPMFTVEQYLMMGHEPECKLRGFVNWKELKKQAKEILDKAGLSYDPTEELKNLSVSDVQLLEITRAISFKADVIIMDEPTSALTQSETDRLFRNIRDLKERGLTILYISHKMDEIFRVSDYITVMRDGEHISTRPASEFTEETLVREMVGRNLTNVYPKETIRLGETVFQVKNLCTRQTGLRDISFYVKRGEILGFAGLMGAGRTELACALFGLDKSMSGEVFVDDKQVKIQCVEDALKAGIMMVSEDRRRYGIVGIRSVLENASLPNISQYSKMGFINLKEERRLVSKYCEMLTVKAPNFDVSIQNLSGGNQQKVILAKWLLSHPKILILDDPTRGIDVGAKYEIYKLMEDMVRDGISIIMTSSELQELTGMCDRIYTMYNRRITGELTKAEFSQELIMMHISGGLKNDKEI